jgi:sarcosine oxidase subunit beta
VSLPQSAPAVVVGGGITGASTLYYLAKAGVPGLLLERELLGAGSTSKAVGGIRAQFSDDLNVRIMVEAMKRFERFGEEPGGEIDYRRWGYLFLLGADDVPRFAASVAMQQSHGVDVNVIRPEEVEAIVPGMSVEGIAAATFSPTDGSATPEAALHAYAAAARRLGATIAQHTPVREIEVSGNRVTGVVTEAGRIRTDHVVVAAGYWTPELLAPLGISLPISPQKRNLFLSAKGDPLPPEIPLTIDVATGFYFYREGEGLLIAGRESVVEELAAPAISRLPFLADLGIKPGWTGYYAMTPDHNPIVERGREIEGLAYAAGFSGHGFMQSPVVGDYLAGLVAGYAGPVDLAPFGSERFERSELNPERNVI